MNDTCILVRCTYTSLPHCVLKTDTDDDSASGSEACGMKNK